MRSVFFSYCHADEALRDQLEEQLAILKRQGVISTWHDRRILVGSEIDHSINVNLENADIILLLVSSAFLASDYCYDREMVRAMQRHEQGEARVIPVILRPCNWHDTLFGKLLATPQDGKPVTQWPDRDLAFLQVANAIKAAALAKVPARGSPKQHAEGFLSAPEPSVRPTAAIIATLPAEGPRSSNLRLAKQFSERDRDSFKLETFEFMARFFENSLAELEKRSGIEGALRRVDANRFTAIIYRDGKSVARCTVFIGSRHFTDGIAYASTETSDSNSFNECLTVQTDDQSLYLRGMGMAHLGGSRDTKLSQEGAAELFWSMLIEPLQHR